MEAGVFSEAMLHPPLPSRPACLEAPHAPPPLTHTARYAHDHLAPTCHHPPTGSHQDLGPDPVAHSPSAGTLCRAWRPSGAPWGPRAAASRTPAAATQHRMTAGERVGNTVTHSPALRQAGCLMPTVGAAPKQPAPALCPVPPEPGRGPAGGAQAVVAGKSPPPTPAGSQFPHLENEGCDPCPEVM